MRILALFLAAVIIGLCIDFGNGEIYCTSSILPSQHQLYQNFVPVMWQ